MQDELVSLERMAKFVFERQMARNALGHLLCVKQVAVARRLGAIQRGFGVLEKRFSGFGIAWKYRHSVFGRHGDFDIAGSIRRTEKLAMMLLEKTRDVV